MVEKLNIAVAGLDRMGKRHATQILSRTPRAALMVAFSPDPDKWAKTALVPYGVRLYTDYGEMIHQEGLQAICIATLTSVHAEHAIKAMDAGLDVMCEKPLSLNGEIC